MGVRCPCRGQRIPYHMQTMNSTNGTIDPDESPSTDTIAAISTAPGEAGIAIVRVSGPRSLAIADRIFHGVGPAPSQRAPRTFVLGRVRGPGSGKDEVDLDEVILLIYRAPHSYTREDVVEIQGHGGRACAQRVLRAVMEAGARLAEPGEFTKRAFLNGRLDLLQAEAVADLIKAKSERAAVAALDQLDCSLSIVIQRSYDDIIMCASDLEASLDFVEDEGYVNDSTDIVHALRSVRSRLQALILTWDEGRILRDGALVVISGRPNVGKSTLFNALLGMDRAIVTDTPGTTRDTIEESVILDGAPVRLIDTAGIGEPECQIEREGVRRAQASRERADIVIYVVDWSEPLRDEDLVSLNQLKPRRHIVVVNKTDLSGRMTDRSFGASPVVRCSSVDRTGLTELKEAIISCLGLQQDAPPHAVVSERHRSILQDTLESVDEAIDLLHGRGLDVADLAAAALRYGLERLGTATGKVYGDELLKAIFSRFCVGK